jgi:hypothetical protein
LCQKHQFKGEQQINPAITKKLTKNSQIFPDIKRKRVKKVLQPKKIEKKLQKLQFCFSSKVSYRKKKGGGGGEEAYALIYNH